MLASRWPLFFDAARSFRPGTDGIGASPVFTRVTNYPFRQPERIFFNPSYNPSEIWITSFGYGLMAGTLTPTVIAPNNAVITITVE